MLARKLIMLACVLCAGSALATEPDGAVMDATSEEGFGIIADKIVSPTEPITGIESTASGSEETRQPSEENKDG
jgi:hypothetical protein